MADNPNGPSWWSTLPGILTAIAGLITAISGFVVVLYQNDILGSKKHDTDSTGVSAIKSSASNSPIDVKSESSSPNSSTPTAPISAVIPWSQAQVIITTDSAKITAKADSLRNCISSLEELNLTSGQSVPFSKLKVIDVKSVDPINNPSAKAALVLMLLDGTKMDDSIEAQCDIFAYNATGRFSTFWQNISKIEFLR